MSAPDLKIEKGVPPPTSGSGRRKLQTWPFDKMEVGDSFLIPSGDPRRKLVGCAKSVYGKRTGTTFTQKAGADGVRVWRIA